MSQTLQITQFLPPLRRLSENPLRQSPPVNLAACAEYFITPTLAPCPSISGSRNTSCPKRSTSIAAAPHSANCRATKLLPLATPPVTPITGGRNSIGAAFCSLWPATGCETLNEPTHRINHAARASNTGESATRRNQPHAVLTRQWNQNSGVKRLSFRRPILGGRKARVIRWRVTWSTKVPRRPNCRRP